MQQSIISPASIAPISLGNGLFLDGEAERGADGEYLVKSANGWKNHYAGTDKRIPTVAECISALRQTDERNDCSLQGILQDLRENSLCAGSFDCSNSNLPVGDGYLDRLVKDPAWRRALEDEVFEYDAPETIDMLQRVSGKRPYISTPSASRRKSHPERAVWLYIGTDGFDLNCYLNPFDDSGRARGVRGSEATGASVSELEASQEIKLLSAPAITQSTYQSEQQKIIYNPADLEYARQLLNGAPSGTVMDWRKG